MPHLRVEYSRNVEAAADMAAFCDVLRRAAVETGLFPEAGVRVRAFAADHVSIADGDPKHGFIDVLVRLRGGRDLAAREAAAQAIFAAAERFLAPAFAERSLALSLEMREMTPETTLKAGTIREHMGSGR